MASRKPVRNSISSQTIRKPKLCEDRITKERDESVARKRKMTLESLFSRTQADSDKTLKLIIKADTQGSVEAIVDSINKIESDKVQSEVVHSGVGSISESDATLASASDAVILGFHAKIDTGVGEVAKREACRSSSTPSFTS